MKAIDIFGLLNDKSEGRRECGQTMAYLATVLIDCAEVDSRIREDGICRYLGCDLATAVKKLATDASDERKYQHHILLRYLTSEYASEELKKAYLRSKDLWMVGYGHPWELIEFYRALLLTSKGEREQHLIQAEKLCDGMDAVLQVICAVFMGSRLITTPTLQSEYLEQVKRCATVVPSLGARLSILEEQPTKLRSPLELAKLVLPFNFR